MPFKYPSPLLSFLPRCPLLSVPCPPCWPLCLLSLSATGSRSLPSITPTTCLSSAGLLRQRLTQATPGHGMPSPPIQPPRPRPPQTLILRLHITLVRVQHAYLAFAQMLTPPPTRMMTISRITHPLATALTPAAVNIT